MIHLYHLFQEADEKLKLLDQAQTEKKSVKVMPLFIRWMSSLADDFSLLTLNLLFRAYY